VNNTVTKKKGSIMK